MKSKPTKPVLNHRRAPADDRLAAQNHIGFCRIDILLNRGQFRHGLLQTPDQFIISREIFLRRNQHGHDFASGNADLCLRTDQAASSLQQTAAALEQVQQAVHHSVRTAEHTETQAAQAAAQAQQGQQVVAQVRQSMVTLERTAARIGTITGVIDDLAFQTNLLALNAAIGQALDQLDQVTQQNAALVEQSVSATAQLRTQADELTALVSRFILPESMPGTLLALQQ